MANYRVSTYINNSNKITQDKTNTETTKQRKMNQLRLFKLKHDLLKISTDLQTTFAAELAKGQWLKEQLKLVKLRMFRVGTRMPTVSRTEGQYLIPLKLLLKIHSAMEQCLSTVISRMKVSRPLAEN
jgi:hypothetical protein